MICFEPKPEPHEFDRTVRQPGLRFLHTNPGKKPYGGYSYWVRVRKQLRAAFSDLCAYTAMWLPNSGQVDHFISLDEDLSWAFEWTNYRYASPSANGHKSRCLSSHLLDPFEVQEGWFAVLLPSMLLHVTDACPSEHRERAERTIKLLKLNEDPEIVEFRQEWYRMYQEGEVNLAGLERKAPLIAAAVRNATKRKLKNTVLQE